MQEALRCQDLRRHDIVLDIKLREEGMSSMVEMHLRDQDPPLHPFELNHIIPWNTENLELESYPRHK
eukprot:11163620-Prorocentrum_lima.AAC.1